MHYTQQAGEQAFVERTEPLLVVNFADGVQRAPVAHMLRLTGRLELGK